MSGSIGAADVMAGVGRVEPARVSTCLENSSQTSRTPVIGLVTEHVFRRFHSTNEPLGHGAVVRLASGQQNGDQAPLSVCECVDLRVAPAARATNSLFC